MHREWRQQPAQQWQQHNQHTQHLNCGEGMGAGRLRQDALQQVSKPENRCKLIILGHGI
jgi:hypothetical protein